jgi:hypothetical protein
MERTKRLVFAFFALILLAFIYSKVSEPVENQTNNYNPLFFPEGEKGDLEKI